MEILNKPHAAFELENLCKIYELEKKAKKERKEKRDKKELKMFEKKLALAKNMGFQL